MHWSRDVDGIDLVIYQQVLPLRTPSPCPEFTCERFRQFSLRPADCDQFAQRRIAQSRSDALARDVATTDKSPPDQRQTHKNFSHSETIARNSRSSSGFTPTSGGRTGPPFSPTISIITFIVATSYPLRRARIA